MLQRGGEGAHCGHEVLLDQVVVGQGLGPPWEVFGQGDDCW